jgi:hypothetical protein
MPYLADMEKRKLIGDVLVQAPIKTKGELNYAVCELAQLYLIGAYPVLSYDRLSDVKGALQDAVDEFKRCVMDQYEEQKRRENGDVWWINRAT